MHGKHTSSSRKKNTVNHTLIIYYACSSVSNLFQLFYYVPQIPNFLYQTEPSIFIFLPNDHPVQHAFYRPCVRTCCTLIVTLILVGITIARARCCRITLVIKHNIIGKWRCITSRSRSSISV